VHALAYHRRAPALTYPADMAAPARGLRARALPSSRSMRSVRFIGFRFIVLRFRVLRFSVLRFRALRLGVLSGTLLISGLVLPVHPAHADTTPGLDVSIQTLAPLIPREASTVRVAGQITNLTGEVVESVVVRLRVGTAPLADEAAVANVIATATDLGESVPTRTATAWVTIAQELLPGAQERFTIALPIEALQLSTPGVYALGVEGFARTVTDGGTVEGVQRSLLPWFPQVGVQTRKLSVAWLWPLATPPAWDANTVLLDGTLPDALSTGGRLRALLDIGVRYPNLLTWVADPALLQMTADMQDGYLVRTPEGILPGEQALAAQTWMADFQRVINAVQADRLTNSQQPEPALHVLPYAFIDASAARRADLGPDVVQAVTMGSAVTLASTGLNAANNLYWAPGGRLDRQTAALLASAGTRYVVLGQQAVAVSTSTPEPMRPFAPAVPGLIALLPDPELQTIITRNAVTAEAVLLARQQFLATTALRSSSSPNASVILTAGSPDITANPRVLAALLRATALAPWLQAVNLSEMASAQPGGGYTYGAAARESELPGSYLARVRQTQQRLERFVAVLSDPTQIFEAFTQALLRSQSAAWRTQPMVGEQLLTTVSVQLDERRSGVEVLSGRTVTLSGDSGRIPVTIVNNLDQPVDVGLRLIGDPRVRLTSQAVPTFSIAPGRTTSVDIPVRVAGSEPLRVSVQVLTPAGNVFRTAPVGTVYSAAYARAAAWVIVLAFAAIIIFVLFGVSRRIIAARRAVSGSAADPDHSDTQ